MAISLGFVGLGLVFFGFRKKNEINTDYLKTQTDEMLNVLDKNLAFSDTQVKTLAKQIKEQNAGQYKKHIQVGTWKGLLSLELEGQLEDKNTLTFGMIQQISADLDKAMDTIINAKKRAISSYCQLNNYEITSTIYTIETNLIKLSQAL
ncbi:hypothetical protein [Emticicia sp. 17c]|uniref:hypothetical protein n=1 Tax=Emticicia sp. 17c TaxID=3127704 RepID=UPI00301E15FA